MAVCEFLARDPSSLEIDLPNPSLATFVGQASGFIHELERRSVNDLPNPRRNRPRSFMELVILEVDRDYSVDPLRGYGGEASFNESKITSVAICLEAFDEAAICLFARFRRLWSARSRQ